MAFQIINAVVVFVLADRIFFASRSLAAAAAIVYVTAPGHAIAACWNALFTMTGAAFFYFLGLSVWIGMDSRWRAPLTVLCFAGSLLSSEHGVTFPLAVAAATLLLYPRTAWRHGSWAQLLMLLAAGAYVFGKFYYMRVWLPQSEADPLVRAVIESAYRPQVSALVALGNLGTYVGFSLTALYDAVMILPWTHRVLGGVYLTLCCVGGIATMSSRSPSRALRGTTFGLVLFGIALAPVAFLPNHVYSYYVGIAAAGLAIALVGAIAFLTCGVRVAPWCVIAVALLLYAGTITRVRQSEEFRFFRSFTTSSARWLYSFSVG
jgi:hypothetical protein